MNAIVQHVDTPRLPTMQSGGTVRPIVPQSMEEAYRLAKAVCMAGMAPKGLETPEKAMIAIMQGMEVGMTPMASLQRIAVVNGRPTIWGDGAMALVRGSGLCEYVRERIDGTDDSRVAVCAVKRRGESEEVSRRFSVADAKKASLWGKQGPWQQYPERMLQMRARAFALRDVFADVLGGMYLREELEDTTARAASPSPALTPPSPQRPPSAVRETIDASVIVPETGEAVDAVMDSEVFDAAEFFTELESAMAGAMDEATVEEVWTTLDPQGTFDGDDLNLDIAYKIRNRRLAQISPLSA